MANKQLTDMLIELGVLEDERLIEAFNKVDRRDFLPKSQKDLYLENKPLPIGHMQTNSQPFTVAFMLELLLPEPGDSVLDVGLGSGWTVALIASMLDPKRGKVVGTERIVELVEQAYKNLKKYDFKNVTVKQASEGLGCTTNSPYDKILVSAAAAEIPQELIDQLKDVGRMVVPVNESIFVIEKNGSSIKTHEFEGFRFVPLIQ